MPKARARQERQAKCSSAGTQHERESMCASHLLCLCGQNMHTFNFIDAQTRAPRTPLGIDNYTNCQLINPNYKNFLFLLKYFSNIRVFMFW